MSVRRDSQVTGRKQLLTKMTTSSIRLINSGKKCLRISPRQRFRFCSLSFTSPLAVKWCAPRFEVMIITVFLGKVKEDVRRSIISNLQSQCHDATSVLKINNPSLRVRQPSVVQDLQE